MLYSWHNATLQQSSDLSCYVLKCAVMFCAKLFCPDLMFLASPQESWLVMLYAEMSCYMPCYFVIFFSVPVASHHPHGEALFLITLLLLRIPLQVRQAAYTSRISASAPPLLLRVALCIHPHSSRKRLSVYKSGVHLRFEKL